MALSQGGSISIGPALEVLRGGFLICRGGVAETCALAVPDEILILTLELACGLGTFADNWILAEPPVVVDTLAFAVVVIILCHITQDK